MWGTGSSSTQCEGAAPASDWLDWERSGHAPPSGSGNGFATRYAEDFAALARLGLTNHRLSIEWARLEPEAGRHDQAAIAHYRDVLHAALEAGIDPWLTLHHFTLPRWFAAQGGFLVESNRSEVWRRHVDFVAETFGDLARGWQPVNETNFYPTAGYRGGRFPPGHDDHQEWLSVTEGIQLATAEAAVRLKQTGVPVASIFALAPALGHDKDPATLRQVDRIDQANWSAGLGLFRDGVLRLSGRAPVEREDLAGAFDMIGFSYYLALGVRQGRIVPHPPGAPLSPLGYGIWADGLGLVLDRLAADLPETPLLVAEYGVGTHDDAVRAGYLARGLAIVHDALERGIDVRGFFHWTGVDNYEWLHGLDVSFGLMGIDRVVRPSALVLQREALG
jgi:beta-glucosidase